TPHRRRNPRTLLLHLRRIEAPGGFRRPTGLSGRPRGGRLLDGWTCRSTAAATSDPRGCPGRPAVPTPPPAPGHGPRRVCDRHRPSARSPPAQAPDRRARSDPAERCPQPLRPPPRPPPPHPGRVHEPPRPATTVADARSDGAAEPRTDETASPPQRP